MSVLNTIASSVTSVALSRALSNSGMLSPIHAAVDSVVTPEAQDEKLSYDPYVLQSNLETLVANDFRMEQRVLELEALLSTVEFTHGSAEVTSALEQEPTIDVSDDVFSLDDSYWLAPDGVTVLSSTLDFVTFENHWQAFIEEAASLSPTASKNPYLSPFTDFQNSYQVIGVTRSGSSISVDWSPGKISFSRDVGVVEVQGLETRFAFAHGFRLGQFSHSLLGQTSTVFAESQHGLNAIPTLLDYARMRTRRPPSADEYADNRSSSTLLRLPGDRKAFYARTTPSSDIDQDFIASLDPLIADGTIDPNGTGFGVEVCDLSLKFQINNEAKTITFFIDDQAKLRKSRRNPYAPDIDLYKFDQSFTPNNALYFRNLFENIVRLGVTVWNYGANEGSVVLDKETITAYLDYEIVEDYASKFLVRHGTLNSLLPSDQSPIEFTPLAFVDHKIDPSKVNYELFYTLGTSRSKGVSKFDWTRNSSVNTEGTWIVTVPQFSTGILEVADSIVNKQFAVKISNGLPIPDTE